MPSPSDPTLIVHSDWGKSAPKRWVSQAFWQNGKYTAHATEPVHEAATLLARLREQVPPTASILVGFDFPIGLPSAYATQAKISSFPSFLQQLLQGDCPEFFAISRDASQISLHRPFYPFNFTPKSSRKRTHLIEALNLHSFDDLLRTCERPQNGIPAAGSLFWTLGAKGPGRAAIHGWTEVLLPALNHPQVKLWPFDGPLPDLLQPGNLVIAETYPTQYHPSILKTHFSGKRNRENRQQQAPHLLAWAATHSVSLTPDLATTIRSGFPQGDDAFDAVLGLFGMLEVALNIRPDGYPTNPDLRNIEGWILGQP